MEDSKTSLMFSDLERVRCETIFDVTALTPARSCTLFDTDDWFRRFRIRFANPAGSGALALEPFSITSTVRLPFLTLVFWRQILSRRLFTRLRGPRRGSRPSRLWRLRRTSFLIKSWDSLSRQAMSPTPSENVCPSI